MKDVPATREVLASLPNVFSALCLNTRGLEAFVECKPFERLFKVLLSADYLPAMRRRRSAIAILDILPCYTKRYGPLRGPTSSSCGGIRPSADGFFCPSGKKRAYYAVLAHFWHFFVSSSNLGNF